MKKCPKCSAGLPDQALFCSQCGAKQPPQPARPSPDADATPSDAIHRTEWLAYVGHKATYYFPRFAKFAKTEVERFSAGWHWPAFFASFWWCLYRKMYAWAGVVFVLSFVPYFNFALWVALPLCANYLYYRDAKRKILAVKNAYPDQDVTGLVARAGGVNRWVIWVGPVVSGLLFLLSIILGAMARLIEMQGGQLPS